MIFDLYKNRELKWNVKDKDIASWELDAVCTLIDIEDWAGEPYTPPEISGGACLPSSIREKEAEEAWNYISNKYENVELRCFRFLL